MADEYGKRKLYLFKDVENENVKELIESINKFNEEDDSREKKEVGFERQPIELYINCFGGSAYDGMGLVDVIKTSKTPVHTIVMGYAMSMAFLIAAVGHKRYCHKHSTYMYHQVSAGTRGYVDSMKDDIEEFKRVEKMYDNTLLEHVKPIEDNLLKIKESKSEWYMDAEEAAGIGLVDFVIK